MLMHSPSILHPHSDPRSFEGTSESLLVQVLLRVHPTITLVFYFSREPGLNTNLTPFVYLHFFDANVMFM